MLTLGKVVTTMLLQTQKWSFCFKKIISQKNHTLKVQNFCINRKGSYKCFVKKNAVENEE